MVKVACLLLKTKNNMSRLIGRSTLALMCILYGITVQARDIAPAEAINAAGFYATGESGKINKLALLPGFNFSISMDKALKIKLSRNGKELDLQISRRSIKVGIQTKNENNKNEKGATPAPGRADSGNRR